MKAAIIAFSLNGTKLAHKIKEHLSDCEIMANTTNSRARHILPIINMPLREWVKLQFESCDLLIFVGACGIAVRQIAPFLVSKKTDPAVVVVDDTGKNVISLLSGHIGGANKWTQIIADKIGANAVITTSSDCNEKTAIDLFAQKNNLHISDFKMAKEIESALLDGEKINLYSEFSIKGQVPKEFVLTEELFNNQLNTELKTLMLIPKNIVVGVGCRRNKTKEEIIFAIDECLKLKEIDKCEVCKIATIDLKKDEAGLIEAAKFYEAQFECYSAQQLSAIENVSRKSEFVKNVTGVDNVCEKAAILGSDYGELLLDKQIKNGVTVAIAILERSISFE